MKRLNTFRLFVNLTLFVAIFFSLIALVVSSASAAPTAPIGVTTTAWRTRVVADGECSLFEALKAAELNFAVEACASGTPGADTIQLPAGIFTATTAAVSLCINSSSCAMPVVREDLTIEGAGVDLTTITYDGTDDARLFFVDGATNGNITLQLRDLALENGYGGNTGAGHAGGAIFAYAPAEIHAERVRFADNEAFNYGGAIYSTGSVMLVDTLFINNHVAQRGGAIIAKHITAVNSEFVNNSAMLNQNTGEAGAIAVLGEDGSLTVQSSTFINNRARIGGAIIGSGLNIDSTIFDENGEEPHAGVTSFGGAIYACNGTYGNAISNSQFIKNEAERGGAIATVDCGSTITHTLHITNVTFDQNIGISGGDDGAALYLTTAPATVVQSTFSNHAGNVISLPIMPTSNSSFTNVVFNNNFGSGSNEIIKARVPFTLRDSIVMNGDINFVELEGDEAHGLFERVTIANNSGSGWLVGLRTNAQLTLRRVTMAHNTFNHPSYGAIRAPSGTTVTLNNSIVTNSGRDLIENGTFISEGGNVIGRNDATITPQSNDLIGTVANPVNALLAPLRQTGASAWHYTAAPIPGSPAIDRINAVGDSPARTVVPCVVGSLDQRGKPGAVDYDGDLLVKCDSGAHERQKTERYAIELGANQTTHFGATLTSITTSNNGGSEREIAGLVEVVRYGSAPNDAPANATSLPTYIEISGLTTTSYNLTLELCYTDWEAEQSAISAETALTLWAFDGNSWSNLGSGVLDTTNNCLTKAIGATATAYMLAEPGAPTSVQLQTHSAAQLLIIPRLLGVFGILLSLTALIRKRQ